MQIVTVNVMKKVLHSKWTVLFACRMECVTVKFMWTSL